MGLRDQLDELQAILSDKYGQTLQPLFRKPAAFIRWLLKIPLPFLIGVISESLIVNIVNDPSSLSFQLIISNWIVFFLLFIYILGYIWQRYHNYQVRHIDRIYNELRWIYQDLNFNQSEHDIRCTLWVPVRNETHSIPKKFKQIVNYVPLRSKMPGSTTKAPIFRRHPIAGRTFKISITDGNDLIPIGVLGFAVVSSCSENGDDIYVERITEEDLRESNGFTNYMVTNWNYPLAQAKRLTQDRRSYLCMTMMNRQRTRILGVLYFDSSDCDALTKKLTNEIQHYLPRIADLLSPNKLGGV